MPRQGRHLHWATWLPDTLRTQRWCHSRRWRGSLLGSDWEDSPDAQEAASLALDILAAGHAQNQAAINAAKKTQCEEARDCLDS